MSDDFGSVLVRLVDAAGAPVFGAPVGRNRGPGPQNDILAITNPEGRFRYGRLTPGPYVVSAGGVQKRVVVAPGQQAEVELRLDDTAGGQPAVWLEPDGTDESPEAEGRLEVKVLPDSIDWSQVRLVRVSLAHPGPDGEDLEAVDLLFSPFKRTSTTWTAELRDQNPSYTYRIDYFLTNGTQKSVTVDSATERELVLDPQVPPRTG